MDVTNKNISLELLNKGAFGNHIPTWDNYDNMLAELGENGLCVIRYKGVNGGGMCNYNTKVKDVPSFIEISKRYGLDPSRFYFNQQINDARLLIQGEVMRGWRGLELRYSKKPLPMRKSLEFEQHAAGMIARDILQSLMYIPSYEDLMDLLDMYDDHVIEFSTFDCSIGTMPRRNTIIWEVRKY